MKNSIAVWDLPIRIFHWALVAAFLVAYITEDDFLTLHVWAGYTIAGLLVFRLLWGFIGGKYARFSSFVCSPAASFSYLKDVVGCKARRYIGHNPAGSIMIVFLLLSLLFTTITGLAVYGAEEGAGPLAAIGGQDEEIWEEAHEFFANAALLLVIFHVIGVVFASFLHRENLVKSMWNGKKSNTDDNH